MSRFLLPIAAVVAAMACFQVSASFAKTLFQTMGQSDMAYWARVHLDIIARFGRFPHRNPVLGRKSTPEELAFLKAGGFAG